MNIKVCACVSELFKQYFLVIIRNIMSLCVRIYVAESEREKVNYLRLYIRRVYVNLLKGLLFDNYLQQQ